MTVNSAYKRSLDYFITDVYSYWYKELRTGKGAVKDAFRYQDEKTGIFIGSREIMRFGFNYLDLCLN